MPDYDSLSPSGAHRGPDQPHDTGSEVRAPQSDDAQAGKQPASYRLVHVPALSRYHFQPLDDTPLPKGHVEVDRFGAQASQKLREAVPNAHFVVLESAQTGELRLTQERDLSGDWTDGGRFDRITLFQHEADAAEYVASRQA